MHLSKASPPTERPAHHLRQVVMVVVKLSHQGVVNVNVRHRELPNSLLDRKLKLLAWSPIFLHCTANTVDPASLLALLRRLCCGCLPFLAPLSTTVTMTLAVPPALPCTDPSCMPSPPSPPMLTPPKAAMLPNPEAAVALAKIEVAVPRIALYVCA